MVDDRRFFQNPRKLYPQPTISNWTFLIEKIYKNTYAKPDSFSSSFQQQFLIQFLLSFLLIKFPRLCILLFPWAIQGFYATQGSRSMETRHIRLVWMIAQFVNFRSFVSKMRFFWQFFQDFIKSNFTRVECIKTNYCTRTWIFLHKLHSTQFNLVLSQPKTNFITK